ncbi:MAG: hypothetical protein BGO98_16315 [Myxococcales bacterium 68-20]|nr:hypothetical protein [Myxococcales bacterium]OJY31586.1 MAG: hypothetical protein BGO98_16315 [Myxococcales bacterium 68-20]
MRLHLVTTAALLLLSMGVSACEKSAAPPGETAPQRGSSAVASNLPAVTAATPPVASSVAAASASPAPEAPVVVADAGKATDGGSLAAPSRGNTPASKHVTGTNFTLDLASPGCKAGAECAMTIKLVAAGDYHVNAEYPYKFVASAAPGIEFLGKGEATTFTRAAGDFVEHGERSGTMTIRFKPTSPGEARVAGTYKFSVCSADQCQIEQEKLDLAVPVM